MRATLASVALSVHSFPSSESTEGGDRVRKRIEEDGEENPAGETEAVPR